MPALSSCAVSSLVRIPNHQTAQLSAVPLDQLARILQVARIDEYDEPTVGLKARDTGHIGAVLFR
jgi:hypothetical protein